MAAETQLNADRAQPRAGDTQLSKFRIAKKAYVFDVKRKYAATRQFSVKKKPETPAEDILASLTVFFQKKKSSGQPEKKAMQMDQPGKNAPKQPSFILNAVKIAFVLLLLFFLAVGFIVLQFGAQPPSALPVAQSSEFGGNVDFSVLQSRIISTKYSENPSGVEGVAYLLVDYNSKNLSSLNFSAYAYKEKPPVQVFMLDHVRESAYNYPIFKNKLVAKLSSLGISANDIGLESLDSLPGGAILLVSTGYFPASLMPGSEYASYDTLLSRGIDIVYVGYPFDTTVLDLGGSTTRVSNKDFRFSPSKPASSSGFELYDPQYTVEGAALIYGSVSAVNRGAGTFVFLPQTLDGGWVTDDRSDGSEKAATDLARLISEQAWRP
ncbi:MAG: hypothetical protein NT051_05255, partial [Candidatus Micrarchaeota archaeon]|nr:hypothetical protein [Candidatus Micrarchaeota archaeon]